MSAPRPTLTLDDPLAGPPSPPAGQKARESKPRARRSPARPRRADQAPPAPTAAAERSPQGARGEGEANRGTVPAEWSGATDVTTLRLPLEVLSALDQRRQALALPKGLTVAAALIDLLDRDDATITRLVEDAEERFDRARRRAARQHA